MQKTITSALLFTALLALLSSCSTYQNLATNWKYRNEYRQSKAATCNPYDAVANEPNNQIANTNINDQSLLAIAVDKEESRIPATVEKTAVASVSKTAALIVAAKMLAEAKKTMANPEFNLKNEQRKVSPTVQNELKTTNRRGGISKFLLISIILMVIGLLVAFLLNYIVGIILFIVGAILFLYWLIKSL